MASALDKIQEQLRPEAIVAAAAALAVLLAVAIALYAIKPSWVEYQDLARKRSAAAKQLSGPGPGDGGGPASAAITKLEGELDSLRDRLYGGAATVPRREIESFVVDSLDRLSVAHGVQLRRVTPEEPGQVWMFEELPYGVQVGGSYFDLHRWLHDVEEELRPMVVKQFGLAPGRDGESVTLDLRLVAYRPSSASPAR